MTSSWKRKLMKHFKQEKADVRVENALNILRKTWLDPVGVKERFRMQRLADELYKSCKIQLTTTRHKGQHLDRGAWLDTLNMASMISSIFIRC